MNLVERICQYKEPKPAYFHLLEEIAESLVGISYKELTRAERKICNLLIVNNFLTINEQEDWKPVRRV